MRAVGGLMAVVSVLAASSLVGCGGSGDGGLAEADADDLGIDVEVPFGLDRLDGVELVGRPAVFDERYSDEDGEASVRSVHAAFRVTADDPPAVLRAALDQLDGLALDDGSINRPEDSDDGRGLWLEAFAMQRDGGDGAFVKLWATEDAPFLLVRLIRDPANGDVSRNPTIDEVNPPEAPDAVAESSRGASGDLLSGNWFDLHVPAGARELVPTLSDAICSTSVLAAEDGEAAVRALLAEADGQDSGPDRTTVDGIDVLQAQSVTVGGGGMFAVVAVRGPDDPFATLYVEHCFA